MRNNVKKSMSNDQKPTRERVKEVALELLLEGVNPTSANVLAKIGKGSMSTINPALQKFWAEDLPQMMKTWMYLPGIPDEVSSKFTEAWYLASNLATQAAESVKLEAVEELQSARQQKEELEAIIAKLEADLQGAQSLLQEKDHNLQSLREQLSAANAINSQYQEQIKLLRTETQRAVTTANERAEMAEKQVGIEAGRTTEVEKRLVEQLEQHKSSAKKQEKSLNERIRQLSSEKSEHIKLIKKLEIQIESLEKQRQSLSHLESKYSDNQKLIKELKEANSTVNKKVKSLEKELASIRSKLDQKIGENTALSKQLQNPGSRRKKSSRKPAQK